MFQTVKIELIEKYSKLVQTASEGKDTFPTELTEFLIDEFDLHASVIFHVEKNNALTVLGRSRGTKGNYLINAKFNCSVCKILNNNSQFSAHSDPNCEIPISEFLVYESCVHISSPDGERFLIKIAKKTAFEQADYDALKKISEFLIQLLYIWNKSRQGNLILSETSFSSLIDHTTKSLRNSANSILGISSILSEENLTSSQLEYVNNIRHNSQALLAAVNDIKALALLEKGDTKVQRKEIDIRWLLGEIVNVFKSKMRHTQPLIELKFDDDVDKKIANDETKLKYIFSSILRIVYHISTEKKIIISVNLGAPGIIEFNFSARDVVLPKESINNFYNPEKIMSDDTLKSVFISGLETNLLKRYSNLLGGDIFIESAPAKGTTIRFRLTVQQKSGIEKALGSLPKPGEHNKVLVVEDDYATSKLMSNYLKKWGYDPIVVNTEEQVMMQIEKEKFLAVILDVELPNVNGLELLRKIKAHPNAKNVPVIACSVEAEEQKAFLMGAVEYFVKPINYNYLVEVLTSYKLRKDSKILCVDDDVPTLNLIKQAIETAGYNAIAEHISANVMDRIKNEDIDLAIIDLDMPHPNGFELIKLIKSEDRFKNLPIIIYTGKENFEEDLKNIDGLFDELLSKKSTNIEDLAETINAMIKRYEEAPPVEEVVSKKDEPKILLAEDYKHSQIIVTRLLKKNNFNNIVIVENGQEALDMAKKEKFDLILMDMQMPVMNGFEATGKIRELPEYRETPIIALTAFAMKGDREKCLAAGATDYIPKPIDSKEFIEKVKYYLSSKK